MSQTRDCEEGKPFLDDDQPSPAPPPPPQFFHPKPNRTLAVTPWIITAISWTITIYVLISSSQALPEIPTPQNITSFIHDESCGSYLPTDLTAMHPAIEYETRMYSGSLDWDPVAKRFERTPSTDGPEYFGPPNKAIDAAWHDLLYSEWTPLTDQEAAPYTPYLRPWGKHYMYEPDVFHSLHCVNEVRKRIDRDYYTTNFPADWQKDWDRIHIDHCLDQLRQAVMCFGDLAPVPLYSWDHAPLGIGRGTNHTCRKWEPIRRWTDQRRLDMNVTM